MATGKSLAALVQGCDARFSGDAEVSVGGLAYDSRAVVSGDAFVAIPGFVHDGLTFLPDALSRGAIAVVAQGDASVQDPRVRCTVNVPDARYTLAVASSALFDHPSHHLEVVGVTGTNGKTTVSAMLEAILSTRGSAGRWSTTTVSIAGQRRPAVRTTPESLDLQRALRSMADAECWAAAVEVSSHALRLSRVVATRFAGAVFTNLSRDHLDFHRDMDDYRDAKASLFAMLGAGAPAVLNAWDPAASAIAAASAGRIVTYGWDPDEAVRTDDTPALEPMYRIGSYVSNARGMRMTLRWPRGDIALHSRLIGAANAENIAAAATTGLELGVEADEVASAVGSFRGVRGRLQHVGHQDAFSVVVDFAHTPDALEAALDAARSLAPSGRVIVVFGCGGDRDRAKRPMMGAVAAASADIVLVTSDNPRSEDPEAIISEILAGMPADAAAEVRADPDRERCIFLAVREAVEGDCVLIAGKGHETEQVYADRTFAFDDVEVARRALAGGAP